MCPPAAVEALSSDNVVIIFVIKSSFNLQSTPFFFTYRSEPQGLQSDAKLLEHRLTEFIDKLKTSSVVSAIYQF